MEKTRKGLVVVHRRCVHSSNFLYPGQQRHQSVHSEQSVQVGIIIVIPPALPTSAYCPQIRYLPQCDPPLACVRHWWWCTPHTTTGQKPSAIPPSAPHIPRRTRRHGILAHTQAQLVCVLVCWTYDGGEGGGWDRSARAAGLGVLCT